MQNNLCSLSHKKDRFYNIEFLKAGLLCDVVVVVVCFVCSPHPLLGKGALVLGAVWTAWVKVVGNYIARWEAISASQDSNLVLSVSQR